MITPHTAAPESRTRLRRFVSIGLVLVGVEVWESAEDHHRFMSDPRMAEDLAAHGVPIPDDITVTPLIIAYQP